MTTLNELWLGAVRELQKSEIEDSRLGPVRAARGFFTKLDSRFCILTSPIRKMSLSYAAAETLWYLFGDPHVEMIRFYAKMYDQLAELDGTFHGHYGHRWLYYDQFTELITLLRGAKNTRQAVLSMWHPSDLQKINQKDTKNVPCTLNLQFHVEREFLHCIGTMRSNDVWLGMPYDIFAFTQVQGFLAELLELLPGIYVHQVGNLHLYEKNNPTLKERENLGEAIARTFAPDTVSWDHRLQLAAKWEEKFRKYPQSHSPIWEEIDSVYQERPCRLPFLVGLAYLRACKVHQTKVNKSVLTYVPEKLVELEMQWQSLSY